jgi:hypothetical protein
MAFALILHGFFSPSKKAWQYVRILRIFDAARAKEGCNHNA